ncbi:hypothetical protein [Grapevine leafroll-associated virus 3m]|nr:hypothetical protein [Grapevine leafroll-associated virus 3m]
MEFRPVILSINDKSKSGIDNLRVLVYDLQYDNIFDNCIVKTFTNLDDGSTALKEYTTNSAFLLSPYKLFSAVFNKDGDMISNDVGSTFRVYNVYPQMRRDVNSISEINHAGYTEAYLGDGQADTNVFFDLTTTNGTKVRWFLNQDHSAWCGILNDLKWEESNKDKFKGRDLLDTYVLSSDYPGFK